MACRWIVSLDGGPRRVNHASVIINGYIYMFGGYCMGEHNYDVTQPIDIHVLNTRTYRWIKLSKDQISKASPSCVPYMRYGHAAVTIGEDVYLWGGRNDLDGACNKVYRFNTDRLEWREIKVNGNPPTARDGHAMCVVNGNIYVYGGYEEEANCFSNDMYILDMSTVTWSLIPHRVDLQYSWRDFHTATSVGDRYIYIFGGRGDAYAPYHSNREVYDSVLKVFDTETQSWSEPADPQCETPMGRRSHTAFVHNDCFYIFGGFNNEIETHFNDIWKYDPATHQWSEVKTLGIPPTARRRHCSCMYGQKVFIFGGTGPRRHNSIRNWRHEAREENSLLDQNDLHVLDLDPSLQTLCKLAIISYGLPTAKLPHFLRQDVKMMTSPNTITPTRPLNHG